MAQTVLRQESACWPLLLAAGLCAQEAAPVALRAVQPVDWHRPEWGIDVDLADGLARRVKWRPTGTGLRPVLFR